MKYLVVALYPSLDIKKRITDYTSKAEAFEYAGALRLLETPYCIADEKGKVLDFEGFGMSRFDMALYIAENCNPLQQEE